MGDFNALSQSDYTPAEWAAHEENNKQRGWDAPRD